MPEAHGPRRELPGRAWHFRSSDSPLHRLAAGPKLVAAALFGVAAVGAREAAPLLALLALLLAGYRLARVPLGELLRDAKPLLAQGVLVVGLYGLRDGRAGLLPGLQTAGQVALFFLPGALLLRTTSQARLLAALERVLPERLAFAFATSLRFAPVFARELREIVDVQRLRGARLAWREVWRPVFWRDAVSCVGVPLVVRALHHADELALAAEVRGLGVRDEPSDREEQAT
jgi:energy-coupling factor transporter transmembrane protein EcfT